MAAAARQPRLRIGIDTGGTFTDLVAVDTGSGAMRVTKVASTPANPAIGLVRAVNAILRRRGSVAGRRCGFGTRHDRRHQCASSGRDQRARPDRHRRLPAHPRDRPPVGAGRLRQFLFLGEARAPRAAAFRARGGRPADFSREELRPLDEASVRAAARFFRGHGVRAIGVCLMHSYANPAHERRVAEIIARGYPDCALSLSCDGAAGVPRIRARDHDACRCLREAACGAAICGACMRRWATASRDNRSWSCSRAAASPAPRRSSNKPITTALSGPAAGALGSAVVAEIAGFPDVVTLDAGGTSTDLCLIEGGRPHVTNGGTVGAFPVRIPMIDIKTIGTGGGSIAWISREGHLKVGPRSAGAEPGPMCYPNGGTEPTITDANLVLGRIPRALIGGGIALDASRSRAGLADLAKRLPGGMSVEQLAAGHHRDRQLESSKCHSPDDDPARHRPAGVRAPLLRRRRPGAIARGDGVCSACAPASFLPIPATFPPLGSWRSTGAPITSSPGSCTRTRSSLRPSPRFMPILSDTQSIRLSATASRAARMRIVREADIRYSGQSMEVRVAAPAGAVDAAFLAWPHRGIPRRASAHLRLSLFRRAENRAGQFLRLRIWTDRAAAHAQAQRHAGAVPAAQIDPSGLFRRRMARHADLRASVAAAASATARTGRGRGVRFHHRGFSAAGARSRCARDTHYPSRAGAIRGRAMSPTQMTACPCPRLRGQSRAQRSMECAQSIPSCWRSSKAPWLDRGRNRICHRAHGTQPHDPRGA